MVFANDSFTESSGCTLTNHSKETGSAWTKSLPGSTDGQQKDPIFYSTSVEPNDEYEVLVPVVLKEDFKLLGITAGHPKGHHGCTESCFKPPGTKRWLCLSCGKELFGGDPTCRCPKQQGQA